MVTRRDLLKSGAIVLAGMAAGLRPASINAATPNEEDVTKFVNPFIGTGDHGHTYPGATVPFGMVQLSPDSGTNGWDWCSGYNYADKKIAGFSHTHLSGTGIGDLCDIRFTPIVFDGELQDDLRSDFSHDKEEAGPGYYAVHLLSQDIKAELTATQRVGIHRYSFPKVNVNKQACIVVDLGAAVNWDNPTDTYIKVENPTTVSGHRMSTGWAKDQHIYFVAQFSRPIMANNLFDNEMRVTGQKSKKAKAVLLFTTEDQPLVAKVGISAVSIEGARRNLLAEAQGWDFDSYRKAALASWNKELSKIQVEGDSRKKTIFYTALYHSMLAPTLFSDVDGSYLGSDKQVHQTKDFTNYTVFSLWDTFRAEHPLLTLFQPDRVDDLIQSMMAFHRESGLLPVWPLVGNETNTMIGYHSVPVIVDAYFKKLTRINPNEALEAMKDSALQDANGLRFYKIPEPTTIEKLRSQISPEMKRIADVGEDILKQLDILCSGYRRTISGNTIGYHSSNPNVQSALIVRTQSEKWAIEWESAPTPNNIEGEKVTFVWLAGLNTNRSKRTFHLFVNNEKWFTFNEPENAQDKPPQSIAPNGARLQFCATHKDQYDGLFGFMFLSVPAGVLKPGEPVKFRVIGENAGTDDWYMTFEHEIKQQVTVKNEYAIVQESNSERQVLRLDIEHVGLPADAIINIDGEKRSPVAVTMGANTAFVTIPKAEKETSIQVSVSIDGDPIATIPFRVRPIVPYNYIPADKEVEAVSKTLECAYDDWCIAQLAKDLGRVEDYRLFTERSRFYQNVFDK
ncbi:MAG TPA: GH92 family glycosyl hydrolase, partial [Blastocatellia bacterium]|nr:GH92 family glycosyl hydrolase [Blastocatellia bacterium]